MTRPQAEFLASWLTEDERRFFAMHATYEAGKQDDPRYCAGMFEDREQLRERWTSIADAFHPDPWNKQVPCTACQHKAGEHDVAGCNADGCACKVKWGRTE